MEERPPLFSLSLLSGAALSYEILLMRIFSIIQWHHFAYMIISLALLGYGVSGSFVAMTQGYLRNRYSLIYPTLILLFGISSSATFLLARMIPFNAEEIFWDPRQALYLFGIFLLLMLPFFFASTAICLTLSKYKNNISRIYACDLLGAGLGSIIVIVLLYKCMPQTALFLISIGTLLVTAIASWELRHKGFLVLSMAMILPAIVCVTLLLPVKMEISPYKGLPQSLRISGTQIIKQLSSPLGLLSVVESNKIPFRHVPGLSLNNFQEPLEQMALFTDADNMSVITKKADKHGQLQYLDQVSSALGYHLKKPEKALILGVGGGTGILLAQYHHVPFIDGVELNPQVADLLGRQYTAYSGELFNDYTQLHVDEIRGFVKKSESSYDLIQLTLADGFNGSAAGVYALSESYLYTVEAIKEYISRLAPGGYLAITRWLKMPPRDTLKLFATAVRSLKGMGIAQPAKRLVLIRSWQTSTLIIKQGEFNDTEFQQVQKFCDERSFDVAFTSKITERQVNRNNILNRPLFYLAAKSLVGEEADSFINDYKFIINPATDDQPYFHHFFKWSSFKEILRLKQQGSAPLLESGYLVLLGTLAIALVVSVALIPLPLLLLRLMQKNAPVSSSQIRGPSVIPFFFLIGIAFLFIEIGFLQKLILFLHQPIFSIASGLAAFLVFAGFGSGLSEKMVEIKRIKKNMRMIVFGIAVFCIVYVLFLDQLFTFFLPHSLPVRIGISIALIAPLATLMGMMFPLGLKILVEKAPQLVPWAWGVNGFASVISVSLATILAIHFGFSKLILVAVCFYWIAYLFFPSARISHE